MTSVQLKARTWELFAQVAKEVVDYKMSNDMEMISVEIEIYHMSASETAASNDKDVIDYINEVAEPYYIEAY